MNRGGPQVIPRPEIWRPGRLAPWAALGGPERQLTVADVRRAFATAAPAKPWLGPVRDSQRVSGVLVALYDQDGLAEVILTRRSQHLRAHKGEVSFPGGRAEPGDADIVATALREASEEIGLAPAAVEVIGELDHLATYTSGAAIVPIVGVLASPPQGLVAEPGEVESIIHVSLAELTEPQHFREEVWRFPDGQDRALNFYELIGDTVWGATARILRQLLALVLGVDPGPGHYPGSPTP